MTTIAVIGDITMEEARPAIEKWFGEWKSSGPKPAVKVAPVPVNAPSAVHVPDATQVQASVTLAEQVAIDRFHPDYYALQLGDHVLGGGFYATRLYRDLRQKSGYVYNVDNSLSATETRAAYAVTYGCDAENVSKARLLVERDLAAMRSTDVTSAELQQAKALLLRQIALSESSEDAVAGGFVARALLGLPLDEPLRAAQKYNALTAGEVRAAFEKWIRPEALVQVVRGRRRSRMSIFSAALLLFGISQLYWGWRGYALAARLIASRGRRWAAIGAVLAVYVALFAWNFRFAWRRPTAVQLTWSDALLVAPFLWWAMSSLVACPIALLLAIPRRIARAARRGGASAGDAIASPARRHFLERTATAAVSAPFIAGAYGLLYGRLNLEITEHSVPLARLPKAFEGFRIAQLSDIHIGPFMPAEQIRKYAQIVNGLRPDLVALTGDFVTFDPRTARPVVEALSRLRAPFGVFGCLGNHDAWAGVEDSISGLFRLTGVRMLRGEAVPIATGGEWWQLIGVDFQSHTRFGPSAPVARLLGKIEGLVEPDRANILLSHNPGTFDRAAELGIGLSLAGHTHGGQLALEFISPQIAPSRLVTPYVAGWFRKPGGRLYVNRGIGTIGVPIRVGAPPEITVYRLARG